MTLEDPKVHIVLVAYDQGDERPVTMTINNIGSFFVIINYIRLISIILTARLLLVFILFKEEWSGIRQSSISLILYLI